MRKVQMMNEYQQEKMTGEEERIRETESVVVHNTGTRAHDVEFNETNRNGKRKEYCP